MTFVQGYGPAYFTELMQKSTEAVVNFVYSYMNDILVHESR